MTKAELRKHYLEKRVSISQAEYLQLNTRLSEQFFLSVDLAAVSILHSFLPLKRFNEPDTWFIIRQLQQEFPNIQISIPRVNIRSGNLEHVFFEGPQQLKENQWGIAEPVYGDITPIKKIDMVLVPLLAFDHLGNRVGYGKGFYDKFLADCRPTCARVGLSFFEPTDRIDDVDDYDQPLSLAVTTARTFVF